MLLKASNKNEAIKNFIKSVTMKYSKLRILQRILRNEEFQRTSGVIHFNLLYVILIPSSNPINP
jgi:hypothetical protein